MSEESASSQPEQRSILAWLGFGRGHGLGSVSLSQLATHLRASRPGSQAEVLASIAEFIEKHDLEMSSQVMAIAHDYVTCSDTMLVRLIDEREVIGQKVTVDWLRQVASRGNDNGGTEELNKTFAKLEKHLIEFGASASDARKATHEYGSSLKGHAESLGNSQAVGDSVAELLGLVRNMIDRTSELEKEMDRSEQRSKKLRRSLKEALRSAEEDQLTGLPNRRAFERMFESEYRDARSATDSLIVAFCDVDHFKQINDTHGHDAGDRVLRAIAKKLSEISSDRCFVARHGGEEFVVLFRGKTVEEARDLLDHTREELGGRRMINRQTKEPIGFVTFSAGIADVSDFPDRRAALKAADSALYVAKGQGRNRIVTALAKAA